MGTFVKVSVAAVFLLAFFALVFSPVPLYAEPLEVVVTGLNGAELENVQAALALPAGLVRDDEIVDRRWLDHFVGQIPSKVGKALEPFGYYETITISRLENHKKNSYRLQVEVTPGEPVRILNLRVALIGEGAQSIELKKLVDTFPLMPGAVLRQDLYERRKGELKAKAIDLGFLRAEFTTHEIRVNRAGREADIELELDTGRRFHFGPTVLKGAADYPEWFLRRHLNFSEGEAFSHEKLGQTQFNFLDSDRFKTVMIAPQQELAEEDRMPVAIELTPAVRRHLRPGLGYGTDTGARFSLRYKDVNLFHRAHLLESDLLIAERKQSLVSSYSIPSPRNLESQTSFRLGYAAENVETYETRSLFAEAEQFWGFGKGRLGSAFIRLLQEDYIVGRDDKRSRMVIPGLRFSKRRYKDPIRPAKGYAISLETRGSLQELGSDIGLLQILASGNTLIPLPARLSLFMRAEGAMTVQDQPFADIPASLRFFAGGDQSLRGYRYQSLGPKDEHGETIGGKHLAVGSVELERALWEQWGVACFYDAGNAFNNLADFEWVQGAGIGLRYYTQVGPLKVDLARQVGEPDPSWRVHVSVGFGW